MNGKFDRRWRFFNPKTVHVNIWAETISGGLARKREGLHTLYGEVIDASEDQTFEVMWHDGTMTTEQKQEYHLVLGD